MNEQQGLNLKATDNGQDLENRREMVRKLGKFAAYAAPFTVLVTTSKAVGGHGSSGGPKPKPR